MLDAAIEQAVTSLVEQHPLLRRARARRFVVSTVYIIWLLGLIGVGLVPGIGGAVTAGASGLGLDARTVGDFAGEGIRHFGRSPRRKSRRTRIVRATSNLSKAKPRLVIRWVDYAERHDATTLRFRRGYGRASQPDPCGGPPSSDTPRFRERVSCQRRRGWH